MAERIIQRDVFESYKSDMVLYSIAVNRRRSIPEIRDGLKPVQRRILYSMYELRAFNHATQRKSSKIVGDTMGNYHSHGDSAIYESMHPMANYWETKVPLIEPDGNWGNFTGDGPASSRYTEAALSKFGYECVLSELDETKNVVDWSKTYDDKLLEPDYLPTKVPIILVNGAYGIGVGMMTEIPKHNLHEVISKTRELIAAQAEAVALSRKSGQNIEPRYVDVTLIPDHCLPCDIIDTDWEDICKKGNGSYKVRGRIDIVEYKGHPAVIVRSVPDRINTGMITQKLSDMVLNKELPMVKDIIDKSGAGKVEVVVQLKKGSDPAFVREILFKRTECEHSYTVNFEVVNGIDPVRMNYKQYLEAFLDHRAISKFRLYCNKLQKVMTRWHKLDAYIKAIESGEIDNIIKMVRKQKIINDTDLIEYLIKKINVTDLQAKFILEANIKQLSIGYLNKYKTEAKDLWSRKTEYETKIMNKDLLLKEIDKELEDIDNKYGKPRVCRVINLKYDSDIPKGVFKLIVTENNYIRKIAENDKASAVKGDNPKLISLVDNTEAVLLFDNKGRVYKLPVSKIPICDKNSIGLDVRMVVKGLTANIIAMVYEPAVKKICKLRDKHFITVVSENNYIKKLDIQDFLSVPVSGIMYTKLQDNDFVKSIEIISDKLDVIIYSMHKALRVPMMSIPNYKRASQGVLAMNTNDPIGGLSVIYPNATHVLVITTSGKANKFTLDALPTSERNKSGSTVIRLGKTDNILAIYGVNDSNVLRLSMRDSNPQYIPIKDIPLSSSVSGGVKLVSVKGDMIMKADVLLSVDQLEN